MTPGQLDIREGRCKLADVELWFAETGPDEGELVILLHGFPESWRAWRAQFHRLAMAGLHVVAPDQRGYGFSSRPPGPIAYDLDRLADDIVGLARHLGHASFSVVGHDWGGSVAWWIASRHPSALERLVVVNAPHPAVWREAMRSEWRQWVRSLYVRLLGIPYLPEWLIRRNNYSNLARVLANAGVGAEELARYRDDWSRSGALTAMIDWYRAFLHKALGPADGYNIAVPTLIVWGDCDVYAEPTLADRSSHLCAGACVIHIPDATHWVHHEQPGLVSELLLDFLSLSPCSG